ncbi:carbamate kinase [Exiguobacterium sp. KRL4]|uniref:carbamate kinase n=1 Tax=Exiguobacterium sp. KRL4 TaxID=1914536 RepID=UPI0008F80864|nr:carbamate kinase [Exiguobacterium sp. KRL4]OIN66749.1 carbamate kinase [Exiguobacterium sp. KRL4]
MKGKRIVIALGGNAIQQGKEATAEAQIRAVARTADALAGLVSEGYEMVVTHGNGPQVGSLLLQQAASIPAIPAMPLDVCVAMTQGMIGYWFQNALDHAFLHRKSPPTVATVVTRCVVDPNDPAFLNPTKPIGPFYSEEEANALTMNGYVYREDAGRGYRRVVPSPRPQSIIEHHVLTDLVERGHLVVASGGGGIPVVETGEGYVGVEAVIDKDFAAEKLAELIEADTLVILTAVEHVAIHYHQPDELALREVTAAELERYIASGEFAPGSMLPKVEAALEFVRSKDGRRAVITSLDRVKEALAGETGTMIAVSFNQLV